MMSLQRKLKWKFYALIVVGIALIGYLIIRSDNLNIIHSKLQKDQMEGKTPTFTKHSALEIDSNVGCDNVSVSKDIFQLDGWQKVDKYGTVYVHSAYFSWAGDSEVLILGALQNEEPESDGVLVIRQSKDTEMFNCVYWYMGRYTKSPVEAKMIIAPSVEKEKNKVVIFKCPLPSRSTINPPEAVSLVEHDVCIIPRNYVLLRREHDRNANRNFTVCIPPQTFQDNREMAIMEWVELNRLLGANHFVFYRTTINPTIKLYSERGWVEEVDWNLENLPFDIDQYGRVAAINDCYRRHRYQSKYIVILNMNEYIIPKNVDTFSWEEMMMEIPSIRKGAFVFHVAYFRTDWSDDLSVDNITNIGNARNYGLQTLLKVLREERLLPALVESKYMVQSHKIKILGANGVLEINPDYSSTLVQPSLAFVHKYAPGNRHDLGRIQDASIPMKYGDKLIESVRNSWKEMARLNKIQR